MQAANQMKLVRMDNENSSFRWGKEQIKQWTSQTNHLVAAKPPQASNVWLRSIGLLSNAQISLFSPPISVSDCSGYSVLGQG